MRKYFRLSNLLRGFKSAKRSEASAPRLGGKKESTRYRNLNVEQLEERQLLSVQPWSQVAADYPELAEKFSAFVKTTENVNIIPVTSLSVDALKAAITEAGETDEDDLILVYTKTGANSITYSTAEDTLALDIDATTKGSISILGVEAGQATDTALTLNAKQLGRVMTIAKGTTVNLGNLTVANGYMENLAGSMFGGGVYNEGTLTVVDVDMTGNKVQATSSTDNRAYAGGGAIYSTGTFTVLDSRFTSNIANGVDAEASAQGGAIFNYGTMTVKDSTFTGNRADSNKGDKGYGGAISNLTSGLLDGTADITNAMFDGNQAAYGGGLYTSWIVTVKSSTFKNSTGDALHNNVGEINISDSFVYDNTGDGIGGQVTNSGKLTVNNTEIYNNSSEGIYNTGKNLSVTNSKIYNNQSGGIYNSGNDGVISRSEIYGNTNDAGLENAGSLTISKTNIYDNYNQFSSNKWGGGGITNTGTIAGDKLAITGNTAYCFHYADGSDVYGGGIFNTGTFTLTNSQVSDNELNLDYNSYNSSSDNLYGAGIYNSGTLTVSKTNISKNVSLLKSYQHSYGGGLYNIGTATISNVLISENSNFGTNTITQGGGVYNAQSSTLTLTNVDVSKNFASDSGAGIYNGGTLTGRNVTIAANSAAVSGGGIQGDASLTNSIITYNFNGNISGSVTGGNNITEDDVAIFVVRPTFETDGNLSNGTLIDLHLKNAESPAVDTGSNATVAQKELDLDGLQRTWKGKEESSEAIVDMGAYEYGSIAPELDQLATPANFKAETVLDSDEVVLSWNLVTNADGYIYSFKLHSATDWSEFETTDLTATISGLTKMATYDFRVMAYGNEETYKNSEWSETLTRKIGAVPIDSPDLVVKVYTNQSNATLSWNEVEFATLYEYQYKLNSATAWTSVLTYNLSDERTGLTQKTRYDFRIRALGDGGIHDDSDWSEITTKTIGATALDTPRLDVVIDTNKATLTWDAIAHATNYEYQYRLQGDSNWTEAASTTDLTATIENLNADTYYEFRVRAVPSNPFFTESDWSNIVTRKTNLFQLAAPTVSVTPGVFGAYVTWTDSDAEYASGYTYQLKLGTDENTPWSIPVSVDNETFFRMFDNLDPNTEYSFRVRAVGDEIFWRDSAWSVATFTTTEKLAMPENLRADETRARSITIAWDQAISADHYTLRWRTSAYKYIDAEGKEVEVEAGSWQNVTPIDDLYVTVGGLTPETGYDFQIQANGPDGSNVDSEWPDDDTFLTVTTLKELAPTTFTLTPTSVSSIDVAWTAVEHAAGYVVYVRHTGSDAWEESFEFDNTVFNCSVKGLDFCTEYDFYVKALGDPGYDYSVTEIESASTWYFASTVVNTYIDEWDLSNDIYSLREAIYYAGTYQYAADGYREMSTTVTFDAEALAAEQAINDIYLIDSFCFLDETLGEIVIDVNAEKTVAPVETYLADLFSGLILDINDDGELTPDIDGVLLERYLTGITGKELLFGFDTTEWGRKDAADIENYIQSLIDDLTLNVTGTGEFDAETDAVLLYRYANKVRGLELIEGFDTSKWGRKNSSITIDATNLLTFDQNDNATGQYVIDAGKNSRALKILDGADTVTMIGIGFQNGLAEYDGTTVESAYGGGVYSDAKSFELDYGFFDQNEAYSYNDKLAGDAFARGGAVYASGDVILRRSSVTGNTARAENDSTNSRKFAEATGGGIYALGDNSIISYCHVAQNMAAAESAGGYAVVKGGGLLLSGHVINSLITLNTAIASAPFQYTTPEIYAMGFGGGICQYKALTVTNSTIAKNAVWTTKSRDSEKGEPGNYYGFGGGICALTFVSQGKYKTVTKQYDITVNNSIIVLNYTSKLSDDEDDLCAYHVTDKAVDKEVFSGEGNVSSYKDDSWKNGIGHNLQILDTDEAVSLFVDVRDNTIVPPVDGMAFDPLTEVWHEDYHLAGGSLAIGAGAGSLAVDENGDALYFDLDNKLRTIEKRVDAGVYEHDGLYGSLHVTTELDIVRPDDELNSLREALAYAETLRGYRTITFADWLDGETITIDWEKLGEDGTFTINMPNLNALTIDTTSLTDRGNILNVTVDAGGMGRAFDINNTKLDVTITGLNVKNGNTAGEFGDGGAIRSNAKTLTVSDASFDGNSANNGGAISIAEDGELALENVKMRGNTAAENGGAISIAEDGELALENVKMRNNTAAENGGAVYYKGRGNALVKYTVFDGNSAESNGGAVYFNDGILTVINSQVTKNTAENGGGILMSAGTLTARNSTFADNRADSGESLWLGENAFLNIYNSIVVTNGDDTDTNVIYHNSVEPESNLSAWNTLSSFTAWDHSEEPYTYDAAKPLFAIDSATGYYLLAEYSQVKDKGNNGYAVDENGQPLVVDLAGKSRIFGTNVDLGAFEDDSKESRSLIVTITGDIVDESDNETSLREAIAYAKKLGGEQTIYFLADTFQNGGTIKLDSKNGSLVIAADPLTSLTSLTIDGYNLSSSRYEYIDGGVAAGSITVDAQGKSRVFEVETLESMTFRNLAIQNGRALADKGGNIFAKSNALTFDFCVISGGLAENGGGLYYDGGTNSGKGTLTLTDTSAWGNTAKKDGGAIYVRSADTTIKRTDTDRGDLITTSVFENNKSETGNGGAIYSDGGDLAGFNIQGYFKAAVHDDETTTDDESEPLVLDRIVFKSNTALSGGAIYQTDGDGSLEWVTFDSNKATGVDSAQGGGAYFYESVNGFGTLKLYHVEMIDNLSAAFGGGLFNRGGNVQLNNSLIADNSAVQQGAGIYNTAFYDTDSQTNKGGLLTARNATMARNLTSNDTANVPIGSGLYNDQAATANIYNSIIILNANNGDSLGFDINGGENGTVNGYYTLSSFGGWDTSDTTYIYDPRFQIFEDAGNGDYRLYEGDKQAINLGNNDEARSDYDLDGNRRIFPDDGTVDLGAYEYQGDPEPADDNRQFVYAVMGKTTDVNSEIWTDTLYKNGDILPRDWPYEVNAYYSAYPAGEVYIPIYHDYYIKDAGSKVTTLSLRIHYDSSVLSFNENDYGWYCKDDSQDIQSNTRVARFDETEDTDDGDANTNSYILITWNNTNELWSKDGATERTKGIFQTLFTVRADANPQLGYTAVNFSDADLTAGFNFYSNRAIIQIAQFSFDIDGDGAVNIATDANLLLNYFKTKKDHEENNLPFTGLDRYYTTANSTRSTKQIFEYISAYESIFDISGDGTFTVETDGALLTRYLAGFRSDALIQGIDVSLGTRQTAEEIAGYIEQYLTDKAAEAIGDLGTHEVSVSAYPAAVSGESFTLSVAHQYSQVKDTPAGTTLSIRVHYDSSRITYTGYDSAYLNKVVGPAGNVVVSDNVDSENFDGDVNTDSYVQITWNDPNYWVISQYTPQSLAALFFTVNPLKAQSLTEALDTTTIHVTAADVTAGYLFNFVEQNNVITLYPTEFINDGKTYSAFDINGDGVVDTSTDCNLLYTWCCGALRESEYNRLTDNKEGIRDYDAVKKYFKSYAPLFNIDGTKYLSDGKTLEKTYTALDVNFLVRYLAGKRGEELVRPLVDPTPYAKTQPVRTTGGQITEYIERLLGPVHSTAPADESGTFAAEAAPADVYSDTPFTVTLDAFAPELPANIPFRLDTESANFIGKNSRLDDQENAALSVAATDTSIGETLLWEDDDWVESLVSDETLSLYLPNDESFADDTDDELALTLAAGLSLD